VNTIIYTALTEQHKTNRQNNTTTTTVLRPLYRSTCVGQHLQLTTGGFCWCKVLLPACLADGNQQDSKTIDRKLVKFVSEISLPQNLKYNTPMYNNVYTYDMCPCFQSLQSLLTATETGCQMGLSQLTAVTVAVCQIVLALLPVLVPKDNTGGQVV